MNQYSLKYDVGYKCKNNDGYWYTIIKRINGTKKPRKQAKFIIQFDDSGYITEVFATAIKSGNIKDRFSKTIYGVACLGNVKRVDYPKEYAIWTQILSRCYNKNNKAYRNYGGNNVTVCDRWLCFDNFLSDIRKIDGFDEYRFYNERLELDKDVKQRGNTVKVYSLETCTFVTTSENCSRENRRNGMCKNNKNI